MIYLKQKTLGGNIIIDRFDSDRMLKATYRLVQIRKKKPKPQTHIFLGQRTWRQMMDWIDIVVGGIVAIFIVGGCLALYADATSHPWEDSDD